MKVDDVKKIAVMGAGVMGHGIAQVALLAGYKVALRDIEQRFVDKGVQGIKESLQKFYVNKNKITPEQMEKMLTEQLQPVVDIEKAVYDADVVIEVVPEDIGIKHSVFKELDKYAPKHAILASNTSMMSITKIAEVTNRPDKVVGMHFFNPPVIMKLVEIVKGEKTSEETMEVAFNLAKKLGKVPVRVEKDSTGFIVNRITAPNMALQLAILDRKLAQPEEIDAMMKQKAMMPMGPYELLDYVGLDVAYDTQQYCAQTLSPDYKPPQFLEQMVQKKELGAKTGKGIYDWSKGRPQIDLSKATNKFEPLDFMAVQINEAVKLLEEGVASDIESIDTAYMNGMNMPIGPFAMARSIPQDQLKAKLEDLAKKFDEKIFEPTKTIREGKLKELLESKEGGGKGEFKTIILQKNKADKIAKITLNRPKVNSINMDLLNELDEVIDLLWKDDDTRVIIITGGGDRAFSAGADLAGLNISGAFDAVEWSRKGQRVFRKLREIPKPVIAAINGYALGGGLELASACDIRIAKRSAQIGTPEVTLGLLPGWGGTQRIAKLIGVSKAMEICLLGNRLSAEEGERFGLINKVYDDPIFDEEVIKLAKEIVARCAPISMAMIKRAVNKGSDVPEDVGLEQECISLGITFSTDDVKEGVTAFMQKRSPQYKGR